jgi:hypothetical protein
VEVALVNDDRYDSHDALTISLSPVFLACSSIAYQEGSSLQNHWDIRRAVLRPREPQVRPYLIEEAQILPYAHAERLWRQVAGVYMLHMIRSAVLWWCVLVVRRSYRGAQGLDEGAGLLGMLSPHNDNEVGTSTRSRSVVQLDSWTAGRTSPHKRSIWQPSHMHGSYIVSVSLGQRRARPTDPEPYP